MILVVCDLRKDYGRGHQTRTKFLLNNIFKDFENIEFYIDECSTIDNLEEIIYKKKPRCIYFDSYSHKFLKFLNSKSIPLILFGDILLESNNNTVTDRALIFDPYNWISSNKLLKPSSKIEIYKGLEYCPIKVKNLDQLKKNEMFVIFRSLDFLYIKHLIDILLIKKIKKIYFHINIFSGNSCLDDVSQKINKYLFNIPNLEIFFFDGELDYELYFQRCKYVVSTASMSSIEAISMGCCVYLYSIALNQESILKSLIDKRLAIELINNKRYNKNLQIQEIQYLSKKFQKDDNNFIKKSLGSKILNDFKKWYLKI